MAHRKLAADTAPISFIPGTKKKPSNLNSSQRRRRSISNLGRSAVEHLAGRHRTPGKKKDISGVCASTTHLSLLGNAVKHIKESKEGMEIYLNWKFILD